MKAYLWTIVPALIVISLCIIVKRERYFRVKSKPQNIDVYPVEASSDDELESKNLIAEPISTREQQSRENENEGAIEVRKMLESKIAEPISTTKQQNRENEGEDAFEARKMFAEYLAAAKQDEKMDKDQEIPTSNDAMNRLSNEYFGHDGTEQGSTPEPLSLFDGVIQMEEVAFLTPPPRNHLKRRKKKKKKKKKS